MSRGCRKGRLLASPATAAAKARVQYTVRNVPPHVDRALRRKAEEEDRSLNDVLVESLSRTAGADEAASLHDLEALAGTWVEDRAFDQAIAAQDQIDEDLWR